MTQKTPAQKAYALVSEFVKQYEKKYGRKPRDLNRYRERYGFEAMIEDLGMDRAKEVIAYYFRTDNPGHEVQKLLYNYEKYSNAIDEREADEKKRRELREETARRVKEWEEKIEQQGTGSNKLRMQE